MNSVDNKKYIVKIISIISLTNLPAILTLPWFYKESMGWILGSLASLVNFLWLAHNVKQSLETTIRRSKLNSVKGSLLRMMFLVVYAGIILWLIKPDILIFGLGLLAAQIAIYLNELLERVKRNKYF